jgi:hypothetical protein
MKRNYVGNVSLASLFLLATTAALAQPGIQANVPFAFKVGSTNLPAGQYLVTEDSIRQTITVQNVKTHAIVQAKADQDLSRGSDNSKMVFHRYNNQYFLSSVHQGSDSLVLTLPVSNNEKEAKARKIETASVAPLQGTERALR